MNIKGVNIPSTIVPFTDNDIYPSHMARYGKGGWRTVANQVERDAIPYARLEIKMIVVTADDGKKWELISLPSTPTTALTSDNWSELQLSTDIDSIDGGTF